MILKELIAALEKVDPGLHVPIGFDNPHSYRGYYDELAFEVAHDTTAGAMLEAAKGALGASFEGYKGGDFIMTEYTDVHLAAYGCTGETIGPVLLRFMLGRYST